MEQRHKTAHKTAVAVRLFILLFAACILLCASANFVHAVTVNPAVQTLNDPADQPYSFVYSIVNNDPQPRTLSIKLDPWSTYLADQVSFSKQQFALLPGQAENLQLTIHPHGLGPETHSLKAGIYDGTTLVGTIELLIIIPGTPVEDYSVNIVASDTTTSSAVPATITLGNYGNIIGYGQVVLTILQNNVTKGTLVYPEKFQVLPGKEQSFDLVYTNTLPPGFYTARADVEYPSKTVSAEDTFSVRLEATTQNIKEGSDLVLTFASLGNPAAVTYSLTNKAGAEVAAGTFLPTSDIVIQTSTLPAGDYVLDLKSSTGEQHITVLIRGEVQWERYAALLVILGIIGYAFYSSRRTITAKWRIFLLERRITKQHHEVTILINRAHRLVDAYHTAYARRNEANGTPGTTGERPR